VKKLLFGLAIMALSGTASAGLVGALDLVSIKTGSVNGSSTATNIMGNSYYHNADGSISQLSATTSADWILSPLPGTNLFTHQFSGLVLDGVGGVSAATAYQCIEGLWGAGVGASLCGNYVFFDSGTSTGNFIDESSVNYNSIPGTRTIGGDDSPIGPMQQMSDYGCIITQNDAFVSGNVVCQTASWIASPGNAGISLTFHHIVPVPAAVWLFGSALGLLGWMKRKAA
jgi:hypothetical protein